MPLEHSSQVQLRKLRNIKDRRNQNPLQSVIKPQMLEHGKHQNQLQFLVQRYHPKLIQSREGSIEITISERGFRRILRTNLAVGWGQSTKGRK